MEKQRLDQLLVAQYPDLSRAHWQRAIEAGWVLVKGKPVRKHAAANLKDVEVLPAAFVVEERNVVYPTAEPRVVEETPGFVVIHKPVGWIMHRPEAGMTADAKLYVADWLAAHYPEMALVGQDANRGGLVHRLDKFVSGLVVAARTPAAFEFLKKQFAERSLSKKYQALVYGVPGKPSGEISFALEKSGFAKMRAMPFPVTPAKAGVHRGRKSGDMDSRFRGNDMKIDENFLSEFDAIPGLEGYDEENDAVETDAKDALTRYAVLKSWQRHSLLELELVTGRTHQIRVHLFAFGLPLVGDEKYSRAGIKAKIAAQRVMLQATNLTFKGPDGQEHSYREELDPEFAAAVAGLGKPLNEYTIEA